MQKAKPKTNKQNIGLERREFAELITQMFKSPVINVLKVLFSGGEAGYGAFWPSS